LDIICLPGVSKAQGVLGRRMVDPNPTTKYRNGQLIRTRIEDGGIAELKRIANPLTVLTTIARMFHCLDREKAPENSPTGLKRLQEAFAPPFAPIFLGVAGRAWPRLFQPLVPSTPYNIPLDFGTSLKMAQGRRYIFIALYQHNPFSFTDLGGIIYYDVHNQKYTNIQLD
jgi:hypothetical protein